MRNLIAILAVLAMGVSAMADVVITMDEDASSAGSLVLDVAADPAIAGMAVEVTVDSGTLTSVAMDGFNVFIDQAYSTPEFTTLAEVATNPVANADAPGAITDLTGTFALCAGSLTEDHAGVTAATITITSDDEAVVTIAADDTRGGAVAMGGDSVAIVGGTFQVGPITPPCPEDVNDDKSVDFGDIQFVLDYWGGQPSQDPDNADLAAADVNDDDSVDFGDIQAILDKWGQICE